MVIEGCPDRLHVESVGLLIYLGHIEDFLGLNDIQLCVLPVNAA